MLVVYIPPSMGDSEQVELYKFLAREDPQALSQVLEIWWQTTDLYEYTSVNLYVPRITQKTSWKTLCIPEIKYTLIDSFLSHFVLYVSYLIDST